MEKIQKNLYKDSDNKYYRLLATGHSVCWLFAPLYRELVDVDVATGKDIYGEGIVEEEWCGTVPSCHEYITYTHDVVTGGRLFYSF